MPKYINLKSDNEESFLNKESNNILKKIKSKLPKKADVYLKIEKVSAQSSLYQVLVKIIGLKKSIVVKEVGNDVYNILREAKRKGLAKARKVKQRRKSLSKNQKRWQEKKMAG